MSEGHSGMLDRLDSESFAAAIFFHLVRYGWAPPLAGIQSVDYQAPGNETAPGTRGCFIG
jgi:hypothetical protein